MVAGQCSLPELICLTNILEWHSCDLAGLDLRLLVLELQLDSNLPNFFNLLESGLDSVVELVFRNRRVWSLFF